MEPVNFIMHLRGFRHRYKADHRINAQHVSLYMALFWEWNDYHFQNPINIVRDTIMVVAKIGSVNTYTRCIKELHQWDYVHYHPSRNSLRPSKITFIRFDKTDDNSRDKTADKTGDHSADNSGDQTDAKTGANSADKTDETLIKTYKTTKTYTNIENNKNKENHENFRNSPPPKSADENSNNNNHGRTTAHPHKAPPDHHQPISNRGGGGRPGAIPSSVDQVKDFFLKKKQSGVEAEKFFNYYQARGWKVNGDILVHDWKAIASNWILNIDKFKTQQSGLTPGPLHTKTYKDYDEPL